MKKIFTLIATALLTMGASAQTTVFSWEAGTATGGTVEAKGSNNAPDDTKITVNSKKADIDVNNVTITLNEALAAGDKIAITGYRNKDTDANGTLYIDFGTGTAIDEGDEVKWNNMALGQEPNTNEYTITDQAGSTVIRMARSKASTNVFITKFVITRAGGGGGDTGSKFTYELATADGIVADFATTTELKGRVFAKVNKDPIVIKAVAGKLPANADGGAQQMTPDLDNPISGKEYTYAVKSVEAWTDASFNANNKFTDWNAIDPKYNMYFLQGTGNPYTALYAEEIVKDEGATHTGTYRANYEYYEVDGGKLPATGCYYKLTPKANGTLKLGIFAGKGNRKTYFIEETSKVPVTYTVEGYIANQKYPEGYEDPAKVGKMKYLTDEEIKAIATEAGSAEYVIGHYNAHFYGYLNATVEKGKSYYLFLHNGQMGLSSVEFNYDEASLDKTIDEKDEITDTPDPTIITGISTLKSETSNTNAQMYNLSAQKVDKSYKGIVIQNGRKFVNK